MIEQHTARQWLAALGRQIRKLRVERNVSQVGFAIRARFGRAYYSSLERGERNVSAINLIRLAKALGVEVGALFPPISDLASEDNRELAESNEDRSATGHQEVFEEASSEEEPDRDKQEVFLSAGAAARLLGVNRRTIERWVRDGSLIPAAKVEDPRGKQYSVFLGEDIDRFARAFRPDQANKGGS